MDRLRRAIVTRGSAAGAAAILLFACATPNQAGKPTAPSGAAATALDGSELDPRQGPSGSLAALVFVSIECPIANAMAPDLVALAAAARPRGVEVFAVHADPAVDRESALRHARAFGLEGTLPVLLDPSQELARTTGATMTPEAALLRRDGTGGFEVVYLGRVNDLYGGIGRRRARATEHDLADAIDAALAGTAPERPFPRPVGCFIDLATESR
jgi:hypothetical protein